MRSAQSTGEVCLTRSVCVRGPTRNCAKKRCHAVQGTRPCSCCGNSELPRKNPRSPEASLTPSMCGHQPKRQPVPIPQYPLRSEILALPRLLLPRVCADIEQKERICLATRMTSIGFRRAREISTFCHSHDASAPWEMKRELHWIISGFTRVHSRRQSSCRTEPSHALPGAVRKKQKCIPKSRGLKFCRNE